MRYFCKNKRRIRKEYTPEPRQSSLGEAPHIVNRMSIAYSAGFIRAATIATVASETKTAEGLP
jgi:hypothetical protein